MKTSLRFARRMALLLFLAGIPFHSAAQAQGNPYTDEQMMLKAKACVMDFGESAELRGWGASSADLLTEGLRRTWLWRVLKRDEFLAGLAHFKKPVQVSGYRGRGEIARMGKDLGVRYVFYGAVSNYRAGAFVRKTKKSVSVGTGMYEKQTVRKYGIAGPKQERDVEVMKDVEVDTAVAVSQASLDISFGVLDSQSGEIVFERAYPRQGEFEDTEDAEIVRVLVADAIKEFVQALSAATSKTDGSILLAPQPVA